MRNCCNNNGLSKVLKVLERSFTVMYEFTFFHVAGASFNMMSGSGGGMGGQGQGMYMNLNGGERDNYAPSSVPSQVS